MPDIQKDQSGGGKKLRSYAKVVVIGGGVVGCSILFHLAKFGWKILYCPKGMNWHRDRAGMLQGRSIQSVQTQNFHGCKAIPLIFTKRLKRLQAMLSVCI